MLDTILKPIMYVVAWIMVKLHDLFAIVLGDASSWAWVLAIVGLTVVVRIALIPLFFRQIKASRGMQIMQPELKKLQEKYKGRKDPASKQAMQQEMMALYKKHGTNPFSSCMPLLLQMPIFFALFRVLNNAGAIAAGTANPIGPLTREVAAKVQDATLFGARLSETFLSSSDSQVKIITVVLIVAMSASQFLTMRQLTMKNMPSSATSGENPMMRQQKIMMYLFPLLFAVTGINFQIGVLIYWLTSNVWTGGQQWYAIRRMPAPGSEAERAMKERIRAKRIAKGLPPETDEELAEKEAAAAAAAARQGQRVQPVRKSRQKHSGPVASSVDELLEGQQEAEASQDARDAGGLTAAEREMKRYQARMARRRQGKKK
ncbi:membrane protein insertase YidC [Buchananella felis]|uniref:membrane protein insertase YidC n=1 Tax=Buchananella felis TaxID=3231492 RepID=UPI003528CB3B